MYPGDLSRNAITLAEGLEDGRLCHVHDRQVARHALSPEPPAMAQNGPTGRGFDRFYGIIQSIRSYYNPPSLMEDGRVLPPPQGDYHFTDAVTEHAVEYIKEHQPISRTSCTPPTRRRTFRCTPARRTSPVIAASSRPDGTCSARRATSGWSN